jgi:hypothetical protein
MRCSLFSLLVFGWMLLVSRADGLPTVKKSLGELKRISASSQATVDLVQALSDKLDAMHAMSATAASQRSLQWAMDHTEIGRFGYWWPRPNYPSTRWPEAFDSGWTDSGLPPGERQRSVPANYAGGLLKEVLLAFMLDVGYWFASDVFIPIQDSGGIFGLNDAGRALFREKLAEQIHMLTGTEPRFENKENEEGVKQWVIYRL